MTIDELGLDLGGLEILPGLINAHDHLEFALFPRLGGGTYRNAAEWAYDIYHPERSPVREHLAIPKPIRLLWGGLRNLLAGVTTVCHHNPHHPIFEQEFPVRVVQDFGWAHSFAFSDDVAERLRATPPEHPFVLHLGEGTDLASSAEILRLHRLGGLGPRTVLVHAVGLDECGWELVRSTGVAVVWCPRSNHFTLGTTLDPRRLLERGIPFAVGTDSPLTAQGDLLDELAFIRQSAGFDDQVLRDLVTSSAARILRITPPSGDLVATRGFGLPPELVVIDGEVRLIAAGLAPRLPSGWHALHVEGRDTVLVPFDIPDLLAATRAALGCGDVFLGGRRILA